MTEAALQINPALLKLQNKICPKADCNGTLSIVNADGSLNCNSTGCEATVTSTENWLNQCNNGPGY